MEKCDGLVCVYGTQMRNILTLSDGCKIELFGNVSAVPLTGYFLISPSPLIEGTYQVHKFVEAE